MAPRRRRATPRVSEGSPSTDAPTKPVFSANTATLARIQEPLDPTSGRRGALMSPANGQAIAKGEREDLQRLVRQREKVLKSAAKQRSADLLADFENQMGQEYSFDQDEVWAAAQQAAETEVRKAQA